MIAVAELRKVARARLRDATALCSAKRYDGATYLAGYAVEIALKARICISLRWTGFPETTKEFEGLASFKTHKLPLLLTLSGREQMILRDMKVDWYVVAAWNPETRYRPVGHRGKKQTELMIASAEAILKKL